MNVTLRLSDLRLRHVLVPALGIVLLASPATIPPEALAQGRSTVPSAGFADLAERLLPAVVNISTAQVAQRPAQPAPGERSERGERRRGPEIPQFPPGSPFEDFFRDFFDRQNRPDAPPRRTQSLGSGFVIDPSGLVVTNNHVIADADEIKVILQDNTQLNAKVVGKDTKTDLALLKVDPPKPLVALKWGNSDVSRVGDWVLAIGNPFGLGGTVTAGIISARARDINAGPYDDFLQTDASINRGNSGGPMFNLAGEVIGINTAIFSPSGGSVGIGFAVPSALAHPVIDQLKEFGRTRRGWLGVNIQSVTDEIAESLGLDKARGALVARVTEKGPAEQGKIQQGDVVLKFDGKEVNEMRRLPRLVAETPVDRSVKVVVWRKGREITLDVKVGELEENEQQAGATQRGGRADPNTSGGQTPVEALGMTLSPLTPELRERFEVPERTRGVIVTKVDDGSNAAERGMRPGDVIVEVAQEEVTTPGQVVAKVKDAKSGGRKSVLVMVERKGEQRFVGLTIDSRG
ncbi:MAG: DegQ family serine endoprotease [Proteobacteria bacterium]|nr:DegQ family serine endoprotease [Pseudomonadota bacterium]